MRREKSIVLELRGRLWGDLLGGREREREKVLSRPWRGGRDRMEERSGVNLEVETSLYSVFFIHQPAGLT